MGNSHFQQLESFLEKSSIEHIGQFHSGGLLEQTRRHKIPRPVSTSLGFPMVQGAQRVVEVRSYCRKEKYCNSRQIVQGKDNQSNRVGVTSDSCGSHLSSMVPLSHSSIYHKGEQEAPDVLFSSSRSNCGRSGFSISWEGMIAYAFPHQTGRTECSKSYLWHISLARHGSLCF